MNWNYNQPVKIVFGRGKVGELNSLVERLDGSKALLITDRYFVENGLAKKMLEGSGGIIYDIYDNISENPDVEEVDECAKVLKETEADIVVVLGGGSAMDLAKAAASVCLTDRSIIDYHGTGVPMPSEHLPIIAIPTTSGTGSEVTCVSVLTDSRVGKKAPIVSEGFYPKYAIIDPELTVSMPPRVTANSGIDVLSHALEGYWSVHHQPICDAMAMHAIELVMNNLYTAYSEPNNIEAREKMAEASVIAGLAFTLPKTTSSHACSYPLTNVYKIPHGEACGLTLDYFTRINGRLEEDGRVATLARKLGYSSVGGLADAICELKSRIGLRRDLKDFNLSSDEIDSLVEASKHPNMLNNPVVISHEMIVDMYNSMK